MLCCQCMAHKRIALFFMYQFFREFSYICNFHYSLKIGKMEWFVVFKCLFNKYLFFRYDFDGHKLCMKFSMILTFGVACVDVWRRGVKHVSISLIRGVWVVVHSSCWMLFCCKFFYKSVDLFWENCSTKLK